MKGASMGTRRKGFTLVEVLIAISVGTVVIGIAYSLMMMSGIEARKTDLDVSHRQEIRYLQEALNQDLQYQDISGISTNNGTYTLNLAGGEVISYSFDFSSKSVVRTGADGRVMTYLKGSLESFDIDAIGADPVSYSVAFTASEKAYSVEVTNRLRAGERSYGYSVPPPVASNPNYLIYIDFSNGKLVRLKDVNGIMIAVPEILDVIPDKIEIVQANSSAPVYVNLYSGTTLIQSFDYTRVLTQFNGKGSADTVPMLFVEGMVQDQVLDLRIDNLRNLSGANASISIEYKYSGSTASTINELKFYSNFIEIK